MNFDAHVDAWVNHRIEQGCADQPRHDRKDRAREATDVRRQLPAFLRHASFRDLEARVPEKDFVAAALGWRRGAGNLLLLGPTGSGKSTASAIAFHVQLSIGVREGGEAWEMAQRMAWFGAGDLAEARKEHPLGRGEAPEIVTASRARLLVLDDAGWDRDPLAVTTVLAARYEAQLPTIITSGMTEDELRKHYGAAIMRRATEVGGVGAGIMARFPREPTAAPVRAIGRARGG